MFLDMITSKARSQPVLKSTDPDLISALLLQGSTGSTEGGLTSTSQRGPFKFPSRKLTELGSEPRLASLGIRKGGTLWSVGPFSECLRCSHKLRFPSLCCCILESIFLTLEVNLNNKFICSYREVED